MLDFSELRAGFPVTTQQAQPENKSTSNGFVSFHAFWGSSIEVDPQHTL